MAKSPASRVLTVVFILFAGLAGLAVMAVVGAAVLMPGCGSCHTNKQFVKATARGPHAAETCASCHGGSSWASRLGFGYAEVFGMLVKVTEVDRTLATVDSKTCIDCHQDIEKRTATSSGLVIKHASCAVDRECTDCHSATAHEAAVSWPRSSTMELCFECHGETGPTDDCGACHESRLPSDRVNAGSFAVTHGPNNLKTHGMGDMSICSACHAKSKCAKCHGVGVPHQQGFLTRHAEYAQDKQSSCRSCHVSSFCLDCHQTPMPHTIAFKRGHAGTVEAEGRTMCLRCHALEDCTTCHVKHIHPVTQEQIDAVQGSGDAR